LDIKTRSILEELLVSDSADNNVSSLYNFKQNLRIINPCIVRESIDKLEKFRCIKLPSDLLKTYSRKLLLKYHQRIMVENPSEIAAHPEQSRYAMLTIFCYVQQQELIDTLAQTIIDSTHRITVKAQTKVKKNIVSEVAHVGGKFDILYDLAFIAAYTPNGVIYKDIYPTVDQ